jgi:hypothetical protein
MTSLVWLLAAGLAAAVPQPQASVAPAAASPQAGASLSTAAKPSVDHERLDALAGTFRFERTATLPGRAPERTTGVSENRWVLGNRYLECRSLEGEGAGEGASQSGSVVTYGFDLRRRVYFALLIGSRGTNYQNLEGFYDEPAHSFVLIGKDAGDGRQPGPKLRQIVRVDSRDRHVVEIYAVAPGRLPQKVIEITYSRQ